MGATRDVVARTLPPGESERRPMDDSTATTEYVVVALRCSNHLQTRAASCPRSSISKHISAWQQREASSFQRPTMRIALFIGFAKPPFPRALAHTTFPGCVLRSGHDRYRSCMHSSSSDLKPSSSRQQTQIT